MKDGTIRTVVIMWASSGTEPRSIANLRSGFRPGRFPTNVQAISASWHTMFLKTDGTVWTGWGWGYGRLGDGGTVNHATVRWFWQTVHPLPVWLR